MTKRCKDCPPNSKRPANYPGPRCYTHHYQKKREDRKRNHERHVQRTYGLEPGEYEKLFKAQGGKCYICRRATGRSKRLAVDHNHVTGEVRGLLCKTCNHDLLGHCRDSVEMLQRAIEYLQDPPARRFLGKGD